MLELVNLSNDPTDVEGLLAGDRQRLPAFLAAHGLDGIEFMCCAPWDKAMFPTAYIHGMHLWFWPDWLDFWRDRKADLRRDFGTEDNISRVFGVSRAEWLEKWRSNIRQAVQCGAEYVVFHVANARASEMYGRHFVHSADEVIACTIELSNAIMQELPEDMLLLYENLWWPGLTFVEPELAARLLQGTRHKHTGFMLDTGHLMNTNTHLQDEEQGVAYILQVIEQLGSLAGKIYGLHLHQSLSGCFVRQMLTAKVDTPLSAKQVMDYVLRVDQHQPWHIPAVRRVMDRIQPAYLVHEFVPSSWEDWNKKVSIQRQALLYKDDIGK